MKNALALLFALTLGTASFAKDVNLNATPKTPTTLQTRVTLSTDQKIKLYVGEQAAWANVSLQDANGNALYNKNIFLKNGLAQQFDVSGLSVGTYKLSVTTENGQTLTKTFIIQPSPEQNFMVQQA